MNLVRSGNRAISVQIKGQPLAIVAAATQAPKMMMPIEISSESTLSMIGCTSRHCRARRHGKWPSKRSAGPRLRTYIGDPLCDGWVSLFGQPGTAKNLETITRWPARKWPSGDLARCTVAASADAHKDI